VRVWDHERKGDTLVEFNLGIKETDGFRFGKTKAVEDFHRLLFQASVDASIDAL
jgi:hypothetical protein